MDMAVLRNSDRHRYDRVGPGEQRTPVRGPVAWSIVLCTLSDSSAPPHDPAYYRDLIANRGTGGLSDFLATVSYGNSDLTPTVVKGWYAMPFTQAQEEALGGGGS
jgi:hypothetical protein